MIFIELFIFLSTILPMFHLINALVTRKEKNFIALKKRKMMSILVPCYNEEDTIALSIKGLLAMDYNNFEAVYINDGSIDDTFKILCKTLELEKLHMANLFLNSYVSKHETFFRRTSNMKIKAIYKSKLYKNFFVIDKQNGGKSDSLNAGICFAESKIIVTLDADSVLERTALDRMNGVFCDENVVAAGGSIHIMQGYDPSYLDGRVRRKQKNLITMQILEYLKGFYIYKISLAKQKATAIISGAFGVFTKEILVSAGGFRKTLGEDIDITICIQQMIHKTRKRIVYLPNALCYTQCPESWGDLVKQRIRWQKGFVNCVIYYRRFLLKTLFTKSLSFHFFIEAMLVGVCSCLFTVFTYAFVVALAFSDFHTVGVFGIYFAFGIAFSVVYSLVAILISLKHNRYPRSILKKVASAILIDIFFYRFFNLFMYLSGTIGYFWSREKNNKWNKVRRSKCEFNVSNI